MWKLLFEMTQFISSFVSFSLLPLKLDQFVVWLVGLCVTVWGNKITIKWQYWIKINFTAIHFSILLEVSHELFIPSQLLRYQHTLMFLFVIPLGEIEFLLYHPVFTLAMLICKLHQILMSSIWSLARIYLYLLYSLLCCKFCFSNR